MRKWSRGLSGWPSTERRGDAYGSQPCMAVDLHGHTAINPSRHFERTRSPGSTARLPPAQPVRDRPEVRVVQHSAFPAHPLRINPHNAVHPHFAGAPLRIPRSGSNVYVIILPAPVVVVLACQHQSQQPGPVVSHEEDRPVLAFRVVLLERHPGPDNFARIGPAVRRRGVAGRQRALEVARVMPDGGRRRCGPRAFRCGSRSRCSPGGARRRRPGAGGRRRSAPARQPAQVAQ